MKRNDIQTLMVRRFSVDESKEIADNIAVEEPLEIGINYLGNADKRITKNISITMRTPGNDKELSLGFLFTEGIIGNFSDIKEVVQIAENSICIYMNDSAELDLSKIERHFYTSSSCGVCGKSSIDSLRTLRPGSHISDTLIIDGEKLFDLNDKVKAAQAVFERTGGLHASALFNKECELLDLFEDVGRHNALDKLIGSRIMSGKSMESDILFLSGRACYELIQKAAMAGIQIICALGAPSSLAVQLANEFNMTLVGFLKSSTFNIYSAEHRIR